MSIYRNFVFTINNWTEKELEDLKLFNYKYIVVGKETGKKNGTPHLQGYCELNTQMRLNAIHRISPRMAGIDTRRGTQSQAIDYCKKDMEFIEFGTPRQQGKRDDLDNVRELALDCGLREVTCFANAQQIAVAQKFLTYNEEGRNWEMNIIWITGPSGCGKSRMAHELAPNAYCKDGSKWWDGYDGHEDIIIDDFRDSWWDITYMLKLLDRYPFRVEYKGGYRQMRAKRIIVTSIKHPSDCYLNTGECKKQLTRRITKIEVLSAPVTEDVPVTEVGVIMDPTSCLIPDDF